MNCLKCGREIEEGQVFCNDCLVQMAKYRRTKAAPEEQLKALKKRIRILSALLSVCVVLLIVLSVVTLRYMSANRLLPGQNYSAVTTTAATEGS